MPKRKFSSNASSGKKSKSGYRYKRRSYRGKSRLAKLIKNVSLRNTETKYAIGSSENVQLYHAGGTGPTYMFRTNMLATSQGNTQQTRLGDMVYGRYLSVKMWLSNKADRPNVMYRIMLVAMPADQVSAGSPTGFLRGETTNPMMDSVNTDTYKVIYQKLIQPFSGDYSIESGATTREHSKYIKMVVPLKNRPIQYRTDGGTIPLAQKSCISLFVCAYDAYGTLTTDNIASFSVVYKFYFKDP